MILLGQFAIRLADIVIAGFAIHAENFVVVFIFHAFIFTPRWMQVKRTFGYLTQL
jgi:hypothetical protein